MMKNILLSITAIWFLVGCAQPAPDLNGNMSDTITIDEDNLNSESYSSLYNSSSDGFISVYFDFDGYSVVPSQEGRITQNVNTLQNMQGSKVKIEGNCDEFGTDEYNYALGLKRAKAIKDALADQGVNTANIVMVSFGESNPVCHEPSDECYARNRRVDLHLVK